MFSVFVCCLDRLSDSSTPTTGYDVRPYLFDETDRFVLSGGPDLRFICSLSVADEAYTKMKHSPDLKYEQLHVSYFSQYRHNVSDVYKSSMLLDFPPHRWCGIVILSGVCVC